MKEIAEIDYEGNLRTNCVHLASKKEIETDAPKDNHGLGQAFSPTDLLAVSLASCMITVMGIAARKHGWAFSCEAKVYKEMMSAPRRVGKIKIELSMPSAANLNIQEQLEEVARSCPVALSLSADLEQEVVFTYYDKKQ